MIKIIGVVVLVSKTAENDSRLQPSTIFVLKMFSNALRPVLSADNYIRSQSSSVTPVYWRLWKNMLMQYGGLARENVYAIFWAPINNRNFLKWKKWAELQYGEWLWKLSCYMNNIILKLQNQLQSDFYNHQLDKQTHIFSHFNVCQTFSHKPLFA